MTDRELAVCDATALAHAIRAGHCTAREVIAATLAMIAKRDPDFNCFTTVTSERADDAASRVDHLLASGRDAPALAGVPYGAKNLFDIAGLTTVAGSKISPRRLPPARAGCHVPLPSVWITRERVLCGAH